MARIVFFGTRCQFAEQSLSQILRAGHDVVAFVTPGSPRATRPVQRAQKPQDGRSILPVSGAAAASRVERLVLNDPRHPDASDVVRGLNADLAVVCCYPSRLPADLMSTTEFGGINVHPSLLPAYRGPDPLFWQFRFGERRMGVTIHQVDSGLDTGPIILQESTTVEDGETGDRVWCRLGELGAEILLESIVQISNGTHSATVQPPESGSYFPWPKRADLVVDPSKWSAWRAHHFIRGVVPLGYQPILSPGGALILGSEYARRDSESHVTPVRFADVSLLLRLG